MMRKLVFAIALLGAVACGKDWVTKPLPKVYIESFEIAEEVGFAYGFETNEFEFEHFYNEEFGYWGGFAYSSICDNDAANGKYENQYAAYNEKPYAGNGFLLYYYDAYNEPCDIVLKRGVSLTGVRLNLSTYTYASITDEDINAFARVFEDGDYLMVKFTAYKGDKAGNSVECYVVDYRDGKRLMATHWDAFDLTGLGTGYDSVRLTLETTDVGEWGANTPLYICLDDLSFM